MLATITNKTTNAMNYMVKTLEQYDEDIKNRENVFR